MQGSPAVLEALNTTYRLLLAIEQQAHTQEHRLEAEKWERLAKWFHKIEEDGHAELIHPLMNRINDLGGLVDSRYAFEPECVGFSQIRDALALMVNRLDSLRQAYIEVCEAAEDVDDYVTEKMVWGMQEWVEKKLRKFERRIAKLDMLGLKPFLAEMMD